MRKLLLSLLVLCSMSVAGAPGPERARWGLHAQNQYQQERGQISVERAARIAQRSAGGRVLAAERDHLGGRAVVRVKLLTAQGVVRVVVVDAASGRILH